MKILGMGVPELVIILAVVLLIFGPKNLPKLGASLGKTVKNLREGMGGGKDDASDAVELAVEDVVEDDEPAAQPVKKTVRAKKTSQTGQTNLDHSLFSGATPPSLAPATPAFVPRGVAFRRKVAGARAVSATYLLRSSSTGNSSSFALLGRASWPMRAVPAAVLAHGEQPRKMAVATGHALDRPASEGLYGFSIVLVYRPISSMYIEPSVATMCCASCWKACSSIAPVARSTMLSALSSCPWTTL